jgi:hypothetical protein
MRVNMKYLIFLTCLVLKAQTAFVPTSSLPICTPGQILVTTIVGTSGSYTSISFACQNPPATPSALSLVVPSGVSQGSFYTCGGQICLSTFNSVNFTYMVAPPAGPGPCPGLTSNGSGQYAVDTVGYLYFCAAPTANPQGSVMSNWFRSAAPMVSTW